MKALKALGLAMALIAGLIAVGNTTANASGGDFSCSGTGNLAFSPGLLLKTGNPQAITASSNNLVCTGGQVTAGTVAIKLATPNIRCGGFVGSKASGYATATWTAPAGMGTTTMKLQFLPLSTSGHTTSGKIYGSVTTTGSNLASGGTIKGNFSINKGMNSVASGGDCTVTIPLKTAGLTLAFHTVATA